VGYARTKSSRVDHRIEAHDLAVLDEYHISSPRDRIPARDTELPVVQPEVGDRSDRRRQLKHEARCSGQQRRDLLPHRIPANHGPFRIAEHDVAGKDRLNRLSTAFVVTFVEDLGQHAFDELGYR
jgi:hypothetical protein